MRNRDKQKAMAKSQKEERLNSKNEFGINDPTPKKCVDNMINKSRA